LWSVVSGRAVTEGATALSSPEMRHAHARVAPEVYTLVADGRAGSTV